MKIDNTQFTTFLTVIKQKIYSAKSKAVLSANRLMIELYFEIGKEIVSKQEVLGWGKSVVEKMSKELVGEFGEKSGYSASNLWRMRNFYLAYKNSKKLAQAVREISWGQNILIFEKCKSTPEQEYYITNTIENGWNRNVLLHQIKSNLFSRDQIEPSSHNFDNTLPVELSELATDIIKSEYNLGFLNIDKKLHEREVENQLIDNIKNFYLNLLNDTVKMPHENPSIGIILCTDKNKLEVEYSLKSISQPMGVSTYTMQEKLPNELKNALPTKEELEELVKDDLEKIEGKIK